MRQERQDAKSAKEKISSWRSWRLGVLGAKRQRASFRIATLFACALLLSAGTILIIFSWRHLRGSDDAELVGWCVILGLGLSAGAAFIVDSVFFKTSRTPLRFVVLRHEKIDDPHFDLMLETSPGSELATWRSPTWPIDEPTVLIQLADHRRAYLTYEGEISGGRGHVRRVDEGRYTIIHLPDGQNLIDWQSPAVLPLMMRREEGTRWLATPKKGAADLSESAAPREGAK